MRPKLIAFAIACSLAAVFWIWRSGEALELGSDPAGALVKPPTETQTGPTVAKAGGASLGVRSPALAQAPESGDPPPAVVDGAVPAGNTETAIEVDPPVEETFEQKYSGLSREELGVARDVLAPIVNEENRRIAFELFDAGKTEVRPLHDNFDDGTVWASRSKNGKDTQVRIAQEDYPEFYKMRRELKWLDERTDH